VPLCFCWTAVSNMMITPRMIDEVIAIWFGENLCRKVNARLAQTPATDRGHGEVPARSEVWSVVVALLDGAG
jgi:hypothetical protein